MALTTWNSPFPPSINGPFSWTGSNGSSTSINYSLDASDSFYAGTSYIGGRTPSSFTNSSLVQNVADQWSHVAGISFSRNDSSFKLVIGKDDALVVNGDPAAGVMLPYQTTNTSGSPGGINDRLDTAEIIVRSVQSGVFDAYGNLLHEIGHSLGISHPLGDATNAGYNTDVSIMSYNAGPKTDGLTFSTPMIYDIAAAQFLYGANYSYNSGSTTITPLGGMTAWTIWDGGGSDTIDVSYLSGSTSAHIDLRGGVDDEGDPYFSEVGDELFAIAFDPLNDSGVVDIENVIGGAGDDVVLGGYVGNTLRGMDGDDTLVGYSGGDFIMGGDGADLILDTWYATLMGTEPFGVIPDDDMLFGDEGNDTIEGQDGFNRIFGGEGDDNVRMGDEATGVIMGGAGADEIFGNWAGAKLFGIDDNGDGDVLYGRKGNDTLYGGARDLVIGDWDVYGPSAVAGNDLMYVSGVAGQSGTYGSLNYSNIGYAEANGGNDTIIGSNSWIEAGEGNDTVVFDKGVGAVYTGGGENTLIVNPGARVRWEDAEAGTSAQLFLGDKAITGEFYAVDFPGEGSGGLNIGDGHYLAFVGSRVIIYKAISDSEPEERDPNGTQIGFDMGEGSGAVIRDLPELGITVARNGSGQPIYGGPKYSSIGKYQFDPLADSSATTPESKTGTAAADHIQTGSAADSVSAGGGNDVVMTHAAADSVDGGDGDDFIQSDDLDDTVGGADTVLGGNGDDFIQTAAGDDSVNAGAGRDFVEAGSGADVARGYAGNDWLAGEAGVDSLYGGNDADTLNGGTGADYLYGESGIDHFVISDLSHSIYTGSAYDRIADFENGVDVIDLGAFDFYTVTTNATTSAGELRAYLNGGSTFTYLRSDQSDFFFGIAGNHLANLDESDFIFGGYPPPFINGSTGADTLNGFYTDQAMYGLVGNDTILGNDGYDTIEGGAGADLLTGGDGADVFRFAAMAHSVLTGNQYDTITDFENGVDKFDLTGLGFTSLTASTTAAGELRFSYSSGSNRTVVKSDQVDFTFYLTGDQRTNLDNSDFIFGPLARVGGTSSAEVLTGTASNEGIFGMEGNDTLSGGSGADTLDGGAGVDRLTGGNGADVFKFTDLTHSVGTSSQYDRIVDFENGVDKIDLSGLGFTTLTTSATTVSNQLRISYSSGTDRTYLQNGQNNFEFFIDGNVSASLDADDFIFG